MKKSLTSFIIFILASAVTFGQSVAGTWVYNNQNMSLTMLLNPDGSGEFQGNPIKYKVQGSQLFIDDGIRPVTYNFRVTQNSLILSGGGMQTTLTFTRPGNGQAREQSTGNYSDGNQQQDLSNPGRQNNINQGYGKPERQAGSNVLSGVWQGPGGTMVIYPDGSLLYNNVSYNYSFSGGELTITGNDGTLSFNCSISANSLNLSQNGNSAHYIKQESLKPEGVDPQLVGKWCILSSSYNSYAGGGSSSEECITLNADGTYIYSYSAERTAYSYNQSAYGGGANQSGDRGTWKTDGITISSRSQNTGKVNRYSFSKENNQNGDPVIVIGGKKFVSAYNRPGWR